MFVPATCDVSQNETQKENFEGIFISDRWNASDPSIDAPGPRLQTNAVKQNQTPPYFVSHHFRMKVTPKDQFGPNPDSILSDIIDDW